MPKHKKKLDPVIREQLILDHIPIVRGVAGDIYKNLPIRSAYSIEDLINSGMVGLIKAIDNYNPRIDCKLGTYARYVIRGHILDSLRALDELSRGSRNLKTKSDKIRRKLENVYHREPTQEEMAKALDLPLEKYYKKHRMSFSTININYEVEGEKSQKDSIFMDKKSLVIEDLIHNEVAEYVTQAIKQLKPTYRVIVYQYYYEDMTMKQIAGTHNINESRISQILKLARKKIRKFMETSYDQKPSFAVS